MTHRTAVQILTATALVAAMVPAAVAGSRADRYGYRGDRDTEYAQVLSARPIYREVRVSEPRQECWNERVVYRDEQYIEQGSRYAGSADRTIGTVLGGVIGGAIGHQFSEGSGKQIATAIGAVVGADVARNRYDRRDAYYGEPQRAVRERVAYEPRCRTVSDGRYEQRVEAYDVTYRYRGQVYNTQMPYDPGARMPVRVEVTPLR